MITILLRKIKPIVDTYRGMKKKKKKKNYEYESKREKSFSFLFANNFLYIYSEY